MKNAATTDRPTREVVWIFGGGITGLSAAHELAERGFDVHVVEETPHPFRAGDCEVGGMARTQWSRFPTTEVWEELSQPGMRRARPPLCLDWLFNVSTDDLPAEGDTEEVRLAKETRRKEKTERRYPDSKKPEKAEIYFEKDDDALDETGGKRLEAIAAYLRDYVTAHVRTEVVVPDWARGTREPRPSAAPIPEILYVEGFHGPDEEPGVATRRAGTVAKRLEACLDQAGTLVLVRPGGLDCAPDEDPDRSDARRRCVRFRFHEVVLPGEHGYRFFPSFYRHLFDVMDRIPILEEVARTPQEFQRLLNLAKKVEGDAPARTKYVETGRTVRDNLLSTEYHSIEQDDYQVSEVLPRHRPPSVKAMVELLATAQENLRFESLDLARYALKLVQYLTSHPERRARDYAQKSWAEFVGVERYSREFQKALDVWPQALVGMRSRECDAHSAGNVTVQFLLDQLYTGGFRDGTLNASTSEAWLDHWRRYLEQQGVSFHLGRLRALRWSAQLGRLVPEVDAVDDVDVTGYVVLALPVERACRLVRRLRDDPDLPADVREKYCGPPDSDLERLVRFVDPERDDYHKGPTPDGPFQHFNGIQFYLAHDFSLVRGHTYYANSEWCLTSISQAQFRVERPDWRDDYRGIVSVDIGSWARAGANGEPAWKCTRDEVAREVWAQIALGIGDLSKEIPMPVWYHIDDDMEWGDDGCPERNRTPYLLTRPGDWQRRPGRLVVDSTIRGKPSGFAHQVSFEGEFVRGLVLAGNYMQTFTRLGTMEAANESARHAVNAILEHWWNRMGKAASGRVPQWCRYWRLEDHELADLEPLKELDRKLFERGLPHFLEILEVEQWLALEWPLLVARAGGPRPALGALLERFSSPGGRPPADWLTGLARSLHTGSALLGLLADGLKKENKV